MQATTAVAAELRKMVNTKGLVHRVDAADTEKLLPRLLEDAYGGGKAFDGVASHQGVAQPNPIGVGKPVGGEQAVPDDEGTPSIKASRAGAHAAVCSASMSARSSRVTPGPCDRQMTAGGASAASCPPPR